MRIEVKGATSPTLRQAEMQGCSPHHAESVTKQHRLQRFGLDRYATTAEVLGNLKELNVARSRLSTGVQTSRYSPTALLKVTICI